MKLIVVALLLMCVSCGKSQQQTLTINGEGLGVSINDDGPTVIPNSIYHNTNNLWAGLTRESSGALIKIGMLGNSLFANSIGGSIPVDFDEGDGARPMRLTYNNLPRRVYDQLSWNKAIHRRVDHTDWIKNGTWSSYTTVFEPAYANERIYAASNDGDYIEITVPDGMENFAFICQRGTTLGTLSVTLNGGSILSYGVSTVNTSRANQSGEVNGNPYHVVEYTGLPAGANVIRIEKTSGTAVRVWGGFYWTGTTLIVHNLGHGGHTMQELITEHIRAEVDENDYDAVIFEMTEMNEMSQVGNPTISANNFQSIITNHIGGTPALIVSTNILGTDPSDGTPNYYATLPGQKNLNTVLSQKANDNNLPYIDVFTGFENMVIANGGTLEAGDAGVYTTDGQHPNPTGVTIWFDMMLPVLRKVLQN